MEMEWTKKFPKLKDCLPISNGVFSHMNYNFRNEVTKAQLDYLLLVDGGQKNPAPVIDLICDDSEPGHHGMLTEAELTKLAELMLAYFKPRWDRLGEIYDIEYDPIHNYLDEWEDENDGTQSGEKSIDRDESETLGTTITTNMTRTDNLNELETRALANSNTRTDDLSERDTGTVADQGSHGENNSLWGFNSERAVNSDSTSGTDGNTRTDNLTRLNTGTVTDAGTNTGTITTANTGTQRNGGTEATTGTNTRAVDETDTHSDEDHRERSGRHFGNIGNLTSQKMINEEIELWKWNYVRSIIDDALDFLALSVYL